MLRRLSALVGIVFVLAIVVALVYTVHEHRQSMKHETESDDTISAQIKSEPPVRGVHS